MSELSYLARLGEGLFVAFGSLSISIAGVMFINQTEPNVVTVTQTNYEKGFMRGVATGSLFTVLGAMVYASIGK